MRTDPTAVEFSNVLAVFACIEEGDTQSLFEGALQEVVALLEMNHATSILIVPFAHLSSALMEDSDAAYALILSLASTMQERVSVTVSVNSFGFHKTFALCFEAYGHPGSVAFRTINPTNAGPATPDQ
jgi:hypothetical protein